MDREKSKVVVEEVLTIPPPRYDHRKVVERLILIRDITK